MYVVVTEIVKTLAIAGERFLYKTDASAIVQANSVKALRCLMELFCVCVVI